MRSCIERSLLHGDRRDSGGEFLFSFAAEEDTFKGHFPNHPILPGVFQLEMTRFACERLTGACLEIQTISKAKFTRPILPEEEVSLSLRMRDADGVLQAQAALTVAGEAAGNVSMLLRRTQVGPRERPPVVSEPSHP